MAAMGSLRLAELESGARGQFGRRFHHISSQGFSSPFRGLAGSELDG